MRAVPSPVPSPRDCPPTNWRNGLWIGLASADGPPDRLPERVGSHFFADPRTPSRIVYPIRSRQSPRRSSSASALRVRSLNLRPRTGWRLACEEIAVATYRRQRHAWAISSLVGGSHRSAFKPSDMAADLDDLRTDGESASTAQSFQAFGGSRVCSSRRRAPYRLCGRPRVRPIARHACGVAAPKWCPSGRCAGRNRRLTRHHHCSRRMVGTPVGRRSVEGLKPAIF